ncbi:MAG: hypothetical protein E6G51_12510 [Actinobacteria bacterium]|nr:MAG: hypothetical protein E6G51_12510 [Actinomycetota bacterium]
MDKGFVRRSVAGQICVAALVAVLACFTGAAAATTGGAGTPGAAPTAKGSPDGAPAASPSAGAISLVAGATSPRKSFYFGYRYPRLSYTIASTQAENDLQIDVVNSAGEVVKTFYRENVAPDVENKVRWDGTTSEGRPARNGRYSFRISPQSPTATAPAARKASSSTTLSLAFAFYGYAFPILGGHEYGMSAGRFGAGRSGLRHPARRRPRRQGPVLRLPGRRWQLRRHRRPRHRQRLHVRAPGGTLAARHRRHGPHRAADRGGR